ncbi:glutathione S-transferase family protein [Microvirga lotononidis]|uniref:Glutathione S-transferase n=1 Tax=Microvirga lotononidis TaxID=864069 RepID=I4YZ58_9HYPH|nr:glutathione S-transferase family protein [Microvirga lotononidis]EIM29250.1 glutathione S-transferase [Microvirga lotononidis]WQO29083.1 glutathione S-transferase family protein [Microvirga lotononidis]
MKLYSGPVSLFSRKVEIALHEKGLVFERILVPFTQTKGYSPKNPDVVAINPKGQVPVLVDGDLSLYDSTVILEYLDEAYPGPSLYPDTPRERARCRLFDVFGDEVMLAPLRLLMHRTEPKPEDSERWDAKEAKAREAESALAGHFAEIDRALEGKEYLCGAFSAADIAVFMAVFWTRRLGGPSVKGLGALASWYARLEARPAFARVITEIRAADAELSAPVEGAFRE